MPPSKWNAIPTAFKDVQDQVTALYNACTESEDADAIAAAKTMKSKFDTGYKKHWESKGKNPAAKTDADKVVGPTLKTMYNTAYDKWKATLGPSTYIVQLKSYTSPQFWHNASNAGTVPKWTYQWSEEDDSKNSGLLEVEMPSDCKNKDEKNQSTRMNDIALTEVKEKFPGSTVKLK